MSRQNQFNMYRSSTEIKQNVPFFTQDLSKFRKNHVFEMFSRKSPSLRKRDPEIRKCHPIPQHLLPVFWRLLIHRDYTVITPDPPLITL